MMKCADYRCCLCAGLEVEQADLVLFLKGGVRRDGNGARDGRWFNASLCNEGNNGHFENFLCSENRLIIGIWHLREIERAS